MMLLVSDHLNPTSPASSVLSFTKTMHDQLIQLQLLRYRTESVEKPSAVEKKYEPVPQVTPSLPPATLPKPSAEGNEALVQAKFVNCTF